jgi:heme/copper-type cytochrome/quinol oxidase subunit 2
MLLIGALVGIALSWRWSAPTSRELVIGARQYAYDPPVIRVNSGDTLHLRLVSLDVVHGLFLEGHDIDTEIHPQQKTFRVRHPSTGEDWREVEELTFVVGKPGKYRYRCSHTCGSLHPFMQGEMIVEPNLPFYAGIGSLVGLFAGMMMSAFLENRSAHRREPEPRGAELAS